MDNQDWVYSRQEDRADPQAGGGGTRSGSRAKLEGSGGVLGL